MYSNFSDPIHKIDTQKIIDSLGNNIIQIPSIAGDIFNTIENPRLSVIQLSYVGQEYEITKFYININPNVEIALNKNYWFDVLNFFLEEEENSIHSYNAQNEEVACYYINREALSGYNNSTYMRKSTGDLYHHPFRILDGEYENTRKVCDNTEKFLCYLKKSLIFEGSLSTSILKRIT